MRASQKKMFLITRPSIKRFLPYFVKDMNIISINITNILKILSKIM